MANFLDICKKLDISSLGWRRTGIPQPSAYTYFSETPKPTRCLKTLLKLYVLGLGTLGIGICSLVVIYLFSRNLVRKEGD